MAMYSVFSHQQMVIFHSYVSLPEDIYLIGGAITILKNDGLRQWEGVYIPYIMEQIKHILNHQPYIYIYMYIYR